MNIKPINVLCRAGFTDPNVPFALDEHIEGMGPPGPQTPPVIPWGQNAGGQWNDPEGGWGNEKYVSCVLM